MTHEWTGSTPTQLDAAIKAMFDRRARRVEAMDLRGEILTATVAARQRRRWSAVVPSPLSPRWARGLILGVMTATIVGVSLIGLGALQTDLTPTGIAPGFVRPFEYRTLADPTFRQPVPPRRAIITWAAGAPVTPDDGSADANSGQHPRPTEGRGIVIGSGAEAWSHSDDGRFVLRTRPSDFLTDLRETGNVPMSAIAETTLDGRPALAVMLPGTRVNDIHVAPGGLSGDFVLLSVPSRLTVADIDGATIFVLIWARTAEDLDAWLPFADEFVSSIHFERRNQP